MKQKNFWIQIMDTVCCSPILPVVSGPSVDVADIAPDATSWFGLFCFSALSLFPSEPAPMQTHGRPVGFPIAVGQGYLAIFKRAAWWINTRVPTFWSSFITFFPLEDFSSEILEKAHVDEKDPICNGATKKNLWMTIINGAEWDGDKCRARRTAAASQETV